MSKQALRIVKNELANIAEMHIYGVIGDFWYVENPITGVSFLRELARLNNYNEIHVHINSPGGDVYEGLAICNAIKSSKKNIHTYNDGICASMGGVILLSAPAGKRHAAKASLTMLHSASTGAWGNAEELRDVADCLEKHDFVLAEIISDATGITVEEVIATYLDGKNHWLTGQEAEALGMVDLLDFEIQPMPENASHIEFEKVAAFYNQKINNKSDMSLFKNPFKTITALAKKPVAEITNEQLEAVQNELETEGVTGLSIVKTEDLNEAIAEAGKVENLNTEVTTLKTAQTADQKTIKDLQAEVVNLKKDLNNPAEEPIAPVTDKADGTPTGDKTVVDSFETSFDRELKAARGN